MKIPSSKFNNFILFISLMALSLIIYFIIHPIELNSSIFTGLIFFILLSAVIEFLAVQLPKGGYVSVAFAIDYACILLFGPGYAIVVAVLGYILQYLISNQKRQLLYVYLNIIQYTVTIGLAGLVYMISGGKFSSPSWDILSLVILALTYVLVNVTIVAIGISLKQNITPWGLWLTNFKWAVPNLFALAPMGLLMAYIYLEIGYAGVAVLLIPLIIARYSFKMFLEMREVFMNTLEALTEAIDAKDPYTRGHSERVSKISVEIARALDLPEDKVEEIQYMGLLHDIGKIGVSDKILQKSTRLSSREFDLVKEHPIVGAEIVKEMLDDKNLHKYVLHHHEWYNGNGYPDGLKDRDIPLEARIISVADVYDAITSDRPYKKGATEWEALNEIVRCSGEQLDPAIVAVFLKMRGYSADMENTMQGFQEVAH